MSASIFSRIPEDEYRALDAINISRLKELKRSPLHYRYRCDNPKTSPAMALGTATHCAVLEPERFERDYAVWDRRTDAGRMVPRTGKAFDEWRAAQGHRTILTDDEAGTVRAISQAVRGNALAAAYLASGDPEVTIAWALGPEFFERPAKGRVDWLTSIDGEPVIVGLKTTRDCRHFVFGTQAARLGYHMQWAFYRDGYAAATGGREARMVEIVVESEAPHAVAVYAIPNDVMEQGRDEYRELLKLLYECERSGEWPGPVPTEEYLTLPSWAYQRDEDDLSDLGLEA